MCCRRVKLVQLTELKILPEIINQMERRNYVSWIEEVLFVSKLSYSLLSVPKAAENRAIITFNGNYCHILDKCQTLITEAAKLGKLYYLRNVRHKVNSVQHCVESATKESLWHR